MGEMADFYLERAEPESLGVWDEPTQSFDTFRDVKVLDETARAWLVDMGDGQQRWAPKSECSLSGGDLDVPEWLVAQWQEDDSGALAGFD